MIRPWVAARAILTERRGALLHLIDADGYEGWGDCAPLPSGGDPQRVIDALHRWACRPASADSPKQGGARRDVLISASADSPKQGGARRDVFISASADSPKQGGARRDAFISASADFHTLPPEARWAIETAQADLAARRANLPLWRHLGGNRDTVEVNAALGPLDDDLPRRLGEAATKGYRIGKIKVGLAPIDEEIARLRALPNGLRLRLDANRAWREDDAPRFLLALRDRPIDAVEEPLAQPSLASLAALQAELPFALALDESLPDSSLALLIESRAVRRLVLKPARLGGITPTRRIAQAAQAAGIEVVLTSVIDSAIGLTATAHLAAALAPALAHGLGTSAWLALDVAAPPAISGGILQLPNVAGLGITPAAVPAGG
ncbi:MAG: enolase C-terminal domain-like protein [Pseudomonadota bacterium]